LKEGLELESIMNLQKIIKKFKEKYPIVGLMDYKMNNTLLKKKKPENKRTTVRPVTTTEL